MTFQNSKELFSKQVKSVEEKTPNIIQISKQTTHIYIWKCVTVVSFIGRHSKMTKVDIKIRPKMQ